MLAVGENKERSEGLEQMAQVRVKMATTTRTSTDQVIRLPRGWPPPVAAPGSVAPRI